MEKSTQSHLFQSKSLVNNIHDLNTELIQNELKRAKEKVILKNCFFKIIKNAPLGKTMENVKKFIEIKLAITEKRRKYLVLEPNYHTKKIFFGNIIGKRNEKIK